MKNKKNKPCFNDLFNKIAQIKQCLNDNTKESTTLASNNNTITFNTKTNIQVLIKLYN